MTVVVDRFHKSYKGTIAVAGLSFAIAPGEILGLIGPNGAGKTTTMRAIAGILTPSKARIPVGGHDVARAPAPPRRSPGSGTSA